MHVLPLRHCAVALLALALLAACDTTRGIAEFEAYRSSYAKASETGDAILDRLAVAEREIFISLEPVSTQAPPFEVDKAAFYTDVVDPPATAAFRRSLLIVHRYNEVLHGLASGATAEMLAGRISAFSAAVTSTSGELATLIPAGGAAATGGVIGAITAVNTAVQAVRPLTQLAFGFRARGEFRQRLLGDRDKIRNILSTLKEQTPAVYDALVTQLYSRATEERLRPEQRTEIRQRALVTRQLLANFIILIDASSSAFETAAAAVSADDAGGSFAGVLFSSQELEAAARAARKNLATGAK